MEILLSGWKVFFFFFFFSIAISRDDRMPSASERSFHCLPPLGYVRLDGSSVSTDGIFSRSHRKGPRVPKYWLRDHETRAIHTCLFRSEIFQLRVSSNILLAICDSKRADSWFLRIRWIRDEQVRFDSMKYKEGEQGPVVDQNISNRGWLNSCCCAATQDITTGNYSFKETIMPADSRKSQ